MASWRKDLPDLPESLRGEEYDGDNSSIDILFVSYSPDNNKETDSNESNTEGSEQSEVGSSRERKRMGRAVVDMPRPTDKVGVQRLLIMVN